MQKRNLAICLAAIAASAWLGCVRAPSSQAAAAATEWTTTPAARELTKLKAKLMAADYRADIDGLSQLRDEVARLGNERDLGYVARYWSGFASWRIAINGANHGMKSDQLKAHLQRAATDFYAVWRLKDDFADGYAAAALVNAWLATFYMGSNSDPIASRERLSLSQALFARASALDPENPRVLWAKGAFLLYTPESQGGSIARAIEVYMHMLDAAERRGTHAASPLPDWGKPEALMSLAYAHSKQTPPDFRAALDEVNAALKLEPDWSYVRDNLKPQIERQLLGQR